MKIKNIEIKNFKRFSDVKIQGLSEEVKLVLVVGPNGSGKSSLFEAFNSWYKLHCHGNISGFIDKSYFAKNQSQNSNQENDIKIEFFIDSQQLAYNKKTMYFRTAYRNEPEFDINSLNRIGIPYEQLRVDKLINNDQVVSQNYQRLINDTLAGVYSDDNDMKTVKNLREELIGALRNSMKNVFDDLTLNNIGSPLDDGAFNFKKGIIESYHYKNLSGGEKSAFDLLLDLTLKIQYYDNTIFLIDEPETHMHTSLQGKLIEELCKIIPDNSQLWLTTHSLGIMRSAQKLANTNPDSVAILDLSGIDFDTDITINPSRLDKLVWEKFLSIALDDFADLIAPQYIILCEGSLSGRGRNNFDAEIYNKIFASKYPNVSFIAGGACNDLEKNDHLGMKVLENILPKSIISRVVDRDEKSDEEVEKCKQNGINVLAKRHLESYLFDDEVIDKLVSIHDGSKLDEVKRMKQNVIASIVAQGKVEDDIKSASGMIYNGLKSILNLRQRGNTADAFMLSTLAELMTEDMNLYKELENIIIKPILK